MSGVINIGLDLIEIDRVRSAVDRYGDSFLSKIYTPEELRYCFKGKDPFPSLAVLFAAKEAISKAFFCGIGKLFNWKSASIIHTPNGDPQVQLDTLGEKLLQRFKGTKVMVSLTHSCVLASAVAVIV